jgi:hypothetical protein
VGGKLDDATDADTAAAAAAERLRLLQQCVASVATEHARFFVSYRSSVLYARYAEPEKHEVSFVNPRG